MLSLFFICLRVKMVAKVNRKSAAGVAGNKKKQVLRGSSTLQFHIECKNPVEDGILKTINFETFLNEQIKVGGKKKQLAANGVQVEATKTKISVSSNNAFSKRYLKYLTKKYLKRNSLRDWLRINHEDEEDSENEA
uniref:Large ribosomal subunit protein eL22 n=1 Tax=Ditylenchus dipsaci TaxID=166011 RepID=A0A915CYQ6_9BILA